VARTSEQALVDRKGDSVACVVGGTGVIGAETCRRLAMTGCKVIVAGTNRVKGDEIAAGIVRNGFDAVSHPVDVRSEASVQKLFDWIRTEYGHLNFLCNSAGIPGVGTALDCSLETWQKVLDVNVTGTFLACKYAIPLQQAAGGGVIVNVASDAGVAVIRERVAYCASKAAVIHLTKQIALDFAADAIRVVAVAPTTVESDFLAKSGLSDAEVAAAKVRQRSRIPLGRFITASEVADAIVWLMSPAAAFVTGSVVALDGGSILFGTSAKRQ
jgi:NAD(P)-dependent dehydrogenase (short-subunit alcohol dehydrogenase family)